MTLLNPSRALGVIIRRKKRMGKVSYAPGIQYVKGSLAKPKKVDGHKHGDYLIGTHREAPTTSNDCTRLYIRKVDTYERTKPFTAEDLARQLRFKTVSAAVAARMKDPAKMIADNTAFNAQSTSKTIKSYLWALEKATYDQQNG